MATDESTGGAGVWQTSGSLAFGFVVVIGAVVGACAADSNGARTTYEGRGVDEATPLHKVVDGPGEPATGRDLYVRYCQTCHGGTGQGDGPAAGSMEPKPRDFTAGRFKFSSTPPGLPPTDGDLYRTIAQGVPGTPMPSWQGTLQSDEIWAIVTYLKSFSNAFESSIPAEQIVDIPERPEADDTSIQRGAELFGQLGCASCHGEDGGGDGPGASGLTDHQDRAIQPRNFVDEPFKSGGRPRDIYRTIFNGLDGTPMAPYGPVLQSDEDRWALVNYVMSLRDGRNVVDYLFGDEVGREILKDYR